MSPMSEYLYHLNFGLGFDLSLDYPYLTSAYPHSYSQSYPLDCSQLYPQVDISLQWKLKSPLIHGFTQGFTQSYPQRHYLQHCCQAIDLTRELNLNPFANASHHSFFVDDLIISWVASLEDISNSPNQDEYQADNPLDVLINSDVMQRDKAMLVANNLNGAYSH